jgi:hypothetical protein
MSKRFTDTKKWNDPWFQDLPTTWKCFWCYVCDSCDEAGIWKVNKKQAEFQIGSKIQWDKMTTFINSDKIRIVEIDNYIWIVKDFVFFQYGEKVLTSSHSFHERIRNSLKRYPIDTLSNTLLNTLSNRVQEEEEEKDKVIDNVFLKKEKKEVQEEGRETTTTAHDWRENSEEGFQSYLKLSEPHFDALLSDWSWVAIQKEYYPGCNVKRTMFRMWEQYWGTKAGWKNKRDAARGKPDYEMNWKQTIELNFKKSICYYGKNEADDEKLTIETKRKFGEL